jgi:hypothetical protein
MAEKIIGEHRSPSATSSNQPTASLFGRTWRQSSPWVFSVFPGAGLNVFCISLRFAEPMESPTLPDPRGTNEEYQCTIGGRF